MNQELERRFKGVQENFRQAREHHDQELQVQRQNYDRLEVSARENTALAQQYMGQVQESRGSIEQLSAHSTNLQQTMIQIQGQLQAKDKQLQMYLQEAQRQAQGHPVLNEAHMGRILRMKVVELEETVGGRNKIIEMLQQEFQNKDSTSAKVTEAAHQLQAQMTMLAEGKNALEQKLQSEQARFNVEKETLTRALEDYSDQTQGAQKEIQKQFDSKQREFEEKISETMKQLELVQKQNEILETTQAELESQVLEKDEELEKARVQAHKLQQDLVETTEILQQQLNQATEKLTKDFTAKQNQWAEERKRLDNAVQELTEQKAKLAQVIPISINS